MLETPGCWACDEMGALFAGVFWGVLQILSVTLKGDESQYQLWLKDRTYGAVWVSGRLFLMGSAISMDLNAG